MKLQTHRQDVERIGVTGEKQFQIKTTAQAFDILSSGIYSDPIMAVVRELSCNAFDAHIDAGKKNTPFEVHLPSKLEPWFAVIDHGIGLSDDDTRGLFTTYFESTKSDDNDKIGAFGLGSKSPFSYSKAFEVIVRFNGKLRTYSVFLNENGVPTIATLASIDTDACNGVEVKLAVRSEDFYSFREKVAEVLRYFPVKPIVKGHAGFEFQDRPDSSIDGDGYYVFEKRGYRNEIVAVQGNVPYRVSMDHLSSDMSPNLKAFLESYGFVGYFEIGQLDVAASREEVRYEKNTKKNLIEKLETARVDFLERLDAEIDTLAKSGKKWEIYTKLQSRFHNTRKVNNIAGSYEFSNKLFNAWVKDESRIDVNAGEYHTIKTYGYGSTRATPRKLFTYSKDNQGGMSSYQPYVTPNDGLQVMLNDVTKRSAIRINNYLAKSSTVREVFAIAPVSDRVLLNAGKAVPTAKQRKDELDRILTEIGNPTIETLSVKTDDVTVQGKKRTGGNTFKKFNSGKYIRNDRMKPVFDEVAEPKDGGIYIEITQLRDIIFGGKQVNWNHNSFKNQLEHMLKVINYVDSTQYSLGDIYGLTKKVVKTVASNKDWTTVEDLYKMAVLKIKPVLETHKRIEATSDEYGISSAITSHDFKTMVDRLPASSHFRRTVEPAMIAAADAKAAHAKGITDYTARYVESINKMLGVAMKMNDAPYFKNADFADYEMLLLSGMNFNRSRAINILVEYIKTTEQ